MDRKTITKKIADLQVLESLADAYAQISSGRMKQTRDSVVLSREFRAEIQEIFKELQSSYRHEFLSLANKKKLKKGEKLTFLSHNGRSVAVFLSSNTGFYGTLTKKIFNLFAADIKEGKTEATIVGKLGLSMFLETFPDRSYSYFELPDYGLDRDKMGELIRHLVEYEEIRIYYGKFKSIINQYPDKLVISANTDLESNQQAPKVRYLFEPKLEDILMFFETEMFSSVFEQTIVESQLAKLASRMLAMDQAGEKVRENLEATQIESSRLVHYANNKKQMEYMGSILNGRGFNQ